MADLKVVEGGLPKPDKGMIHIAVTPQNAEVIVYGDGFMLHFSTERELAQFIHHLKNARKEQRKQVWRNNLPG